MSMRRNSGARGVAVLALVAGSWFAAIVLFGHSVASAPQPEDAALSEPPSSPTVAPGLSRLLASYQRTPSRSRLASVPKMFGDSINHFAEITSQ